MNLTQLKSVVKRCESELNSIGYEVPKGITYRISNRMTRALGNCRETRRGYGIAPRITISISSDLPVEVAHHTVMHEMIHAIVGAAAGHGWKFQQLAHIINHKLGYNIGTYANQAESVAIRSVRSEKLKETGRTIECTSCHKTHIVKPNAKVVRSPMSYRCRCGGSLKVL